MSTPQSGGAVASTGKKAVHVKWAGKTIALGTFPAAEADEKCARAKALTRAWRSTMRPKPSRDWVMLELERLGVRVVSGRLGRKAGDDGDEGGVDKKQGSPHPAGQLTAGGQSADRNNSMGWGGTSDADLSLMMARRNSSLGLSMINDAGRRGSLGSLGQAVGLDTGDPTMPPHRPLVGGGAAAAYEAARHDHYNQKSAEQQRRASSLGLGSLGGGLGSMGGMSVNPNQHYEMLKLHHMNLLNEIQETTLMMNLYQQQQLQQQQQQLQQQAAGDKMGSGDTGMASMAGLDMFGSQLSQQQRASLGLGGNFSAQQQMQMMQQQQQQQQMMQGGQGTDNAPGSMGAQGTDNAPGSMGAQGTDNAPGSLGAQGTDNAPATNAPGTSGGQQQEPGQSNEQSEQAKQDTTEKGGETGDTTEAAPSTGETATSTEKKRPAEEEQATEEEANKRAKVDEKEFEGGKEDNDDKEEEPQTEDV